MTIAPFTIDGSSCDRCCGSSSSSSSASSSSSVSDSPGPPPSSSSGPPPIGRDCECCIEDTVPEYVDITMPTLKQNHCTTECNEYSGKKVRFTRLVTGGDSCEWRFLDSFDACPVPQGGFDLDWTGVTGFATLTCEGEGDQYRRELIVTWRAGGLTTVWEADLGLFDDQTFDCTTIDETLDWDRHVNQSWSVNPCYGESGSTVRWQSVS